MAKKLTSEKARKILHDKEVHGQPLTDKQRKFFGAIAGGAKPYQDGGWLDKYEEGGVLKQKKQDNYGTKPNVNNSDVSLPPGFVGMAYNTKGRNYSPAWGGQFQMGGSLPGATGFMYARTINPAPANGPYAKKTKASAQNGEEVMKGREFVEKWMNSPMYKQMLEKSAQGPEFERISKGRIASFNVPTNVSRDINLEGTGTLGQTQHRVRTILNATGPEYEEMMKIMQKTIDNPKDKEAKRRAEEVMQPIITGWNIGLNPKLKPGTIDYEATLAHEYGHTTDNPFISKFPYQMPRKEAINLDTQTYIPKSDIEKMKAYSQGKVNDDLTKYISKPQETRQYLNDIRYLGKSQGLYDPFSEKITTEQFRKIQPLQYGDPMQTLRQVYTDEQIIDMLNSISRTQRANGVPVAQNGQEMKYYQEGLDFKPKTISQDGSQLNLIPRATGDLRGPKIDPRFSENVAAAKDRKAYSTFEELRSTPGLKLYSDEELTKLSKQDPSKWSKHVKQEYADRQSKKTLIQAHPDYNPEMPFESQEALASDKSLRARVLRGKNLLTGSEYGPTPLAIANQIITAPANLVSNLAFNPYEKYIKPGVAEGLTNVLSDVMDAIDPVNPGTVMKAAIKTAPKAALKLSTALPFYTTLRRLEDAHPVDINTFTRSADRLKELVTAPASRQAFKDVAEQLSLPRVVQADPDYVRAINDPDLPVQSIDEVVKSLTAVDPAEVALNREQLKYVKNLGSLSTDIITLSERSPNASSEDIANFIIEQSGTSSPRDVVPFIHSLRGLSGDQKMDIITRLYDSRAGAATNNPLARFTAAQDLFTLAERFRDIPQMLSSGQLSSSAGRTYLGTQVRQGFENLIGSAESVRPITGINPQYQYEAGNYYDAEDVFGSLFRQTYDRVPTAAERAAASQDVARKVMKRQKEIFTPPKREDYTSDLRYDMAVRNFESNMGKTFVGSKSMSSDSYEMAQRAAMMKDRLNFDIIPMWSGSLAGINARPSLANSFGGITKLGSARQAYSENIQDALTNRLTTGLNSAEKDMVRMQRNPLDPRVIQNLMIETRMANATNAELNRQLGTNIPTSIVDRFGRGIQRPAIGFIPKSGSAPTPMFTPVMSLMDGGDVVKDDMGYWNPNNWGKVVEIDSNEITMQGVDQPLLGVSDAGDVKKMKPGKNYKFKGTKVREYPVAKEGVSVNNADAQPLKKLDQSLNFTNYNKPTKGGWLDKYQ